MKINAGSLLTECWKSEIIGSYIKTDDEDEYAGMRLQESSRKVEREQAEAGGMDFIRAD